ncbi:hypothetical protein ACMD2_08838, partial [Ananas comosus]
DENWAAYHTSYIQRWDDRLVDIVEVHPEVDPDPIRATTVYMQWYWRITRMWISRPVQRPPLACKPRGHVERVLIEAVLETLPTLPHTVPPRPAEYGGLSTSGHIPVYSPPRPSSSIEEPPYHPDTVPTPVPENPPRPVDIVYH